MKQTKPTPKAKLATPAAPSTKAERPIIPVAETPEEKARAEKMAAAMVKQGLANIDLAGDGIQNVINTGLTMQIAQREFTEFLMTADADEVRTLSRLLLGRRQGGVKLQETVINWGIEATQDEPEEREYLETCRTIHRADRGSSTPVETLITTLVRYYREKITPDDVRRFVETFESDFDDVIVHAKRYAKDYPEMVLPAVPAEMKSVA